MNDKEHTMLIAKSNLKLQCLNLAYVIIVMHISSSLCDYSDAYILVKEKITITGAGDDAEARQAGERGKGVAFKNVLHLLIA